MIPQLSVATSLNAISFLRYLVRGHKGFILGIIFVGIASTSCSLFFVWLSKEVIDIVTGVSPNSWRLYAVGLVLTMGLQALFRLINVWLRNHAMVRLSSAVRLRVFSHLLYARWQSLSTMHSGDILTRIIKDTDDVVTLLVVSIPSVISSLVQLGGALILLYIFSPTLALLLGIVMPLIVIGSRLYYRRMLRYSNAVKHTESRITSQMQEALNNHTIIRTFERQDDEIDHLRFVQGELYGVVNKQTRVSVIANLILSAAFSGGYLIAFLWGAYGLRSGIISFGTMTSFLQLVSRIQRPLIDLMGTIPSVISAKAAVDRLINILEFQTERKEGSIYLSGSIRLEVEQLKFQYEPTAPYIFDGFSFVASSGEMIAIVGRTGVGKTTLVRLLLGLVHPVSGRLTLVDEGKSVHISEATRSNFVYVPQGSSLFSGSIRDNLLVGNPHASEGKLREVLEVAVATFVFDLPQGLDTILGEHNIGLSEGQAQRIAIARSLLRPGKILLFDEASSALDRATEQEFLLRLKNYLGDRIVLFITHHREVIDFCDKVIQL